MSAFFFLVATSLTVFAGAGLKSSIPVSGTTGTTVSTAMFSDDPRMVLKAR